MADLSILQIILAIGAVTLGALTQGSVGFGFAMVAAPLLMLIDVSFVPGPVILAAFFTALWVGIRDRKSGTIKTVKWAIFGRMIGNLAGAALVAYLSQDKFTIIFGILVIIAVLISLSGIDVKINISNLLAAGFLSGFMGTTVSISGPPMALLFQNEKGPNFRGMMAIFFMIGIMLSIPSLMIMGVFGLQEFLQGLILLPGTLLGVLLSKFLISRLDRHSIRPYVLGLSSVSGLLAIIKVFI